MFTILKKAAMLALSLCFATSTALAALPQNQPNSPYAQDNAQVLNPHIVQYLNTLGQEVATKTQTKLIVVTAKKLTNKTIEEDAQALFASFQLEGDKKEKSCLLLVAVDDHKFCFKLSTGLEEKIPNTLLNKINVTMLLPGFKDAQYNDSILKAYNAISQQLANQQKITLSSYQPVEKVERDATSTMDLLETLIPIFVALVFGCYFIYRYLLKPLITARHKEK